MLSYELAKELKEKGFPIKTMDEVINITLGGEIDGIDYAFPTLSELIDACVYFGMTYREGMPAFRMKLEGGQVEKSKGWRAVEVFAEIEGLDGEGDTPEEAVARLYLQLVRNNPLVAE
jgi:hypothetical protein